MSAILHYRYIISYSPAKSKHFFGQSRCRRGKAAFDSPCRAPVRPAGRFGPAETGGLRPPRPPPSPGEGGGRPCGPSLPTGKFPPYRKRSGISAAPSFFPHSCSDLPASTAKAPPAPGAISAAGTMPPPRRTKSRTPTRPAPRKRPGAARRTTGSSAGSPRTPSLPLLYFLFLGRFFRTEKPKEPTFLPRAKYSPWE